MSVKLNTIPIKSINLEISKFDDKHVLIYNKLIDRRLKVGVDTEVLLTLVNGENTINQIAEQFGKITGNRIDGYEVHEVLYNRLAPHGVIQSEKYDPQKKDYASYLSLRIQLLTPHQVYKVSWIIKKLFTPSFFYPSLLIMLIFVICSQVFFNSIEYFKSSVTQPFVYILFLVNIISLFLHELGHAAACRQFGAKHGGIGFGFYMFTPVLYADVTDAWRLNRSERVIIDLAGLYMQSIVNIGLLLIYFILNEPFLLQIAFISLVGMLFNLNPFFRRDGYWAVSDIFNITNLKAKSNGKIREFFWFLFKQNSNPLYNSANIGLFIYGLLDWSFIVLFLGSIIFNNPTGILLYPINFVLTLVTLVNNTPENFFELKELLYPLLVPTVFYLIVIKRFIVFYKKRNQQKIQKNEEV